MAVFHHRELIAGRIELDFVHKVLGQQPPGDRRRRPARRPRWVRPSGAAASRLHPVRKTKVAARREKMRVEMKAGIATHSPAVPQRALQHGLQGDADPNPLRFVDQLQAQPSRPASGRRSASPATLSGAGLKLHVVFREKLRQPRRSRAACTTPRASRSVSIRSRSRLPAGA